MCPRFIILDHLFADDMALTANLLFTWARVEAECVETLQDKLDGKFDGKQSESIASVGPSP